MMLLTAALLPAMAADPLTESLQTRDGVKLEADIYAVSGATSGVVLLHMIPPHWERSSWPAPFIDALADKGWAVCVIDRRGAGKSEGDPKEAYEGDKGRYDVEACVKRLGTDGVTTLAVIGASNGTTSALDYAAWSATEDALPVPAALGFMTGGAYTTAQTPLEAAAEIPALFTYSTAERKWSAEAEGGAPGWVHKEYAGGEHGTKMFEAKPEVLGDLVTFLGAHL